MTARRPSRRLRPLTVAAAVVVVLVALKALDEDRSLPSVIEDVAAADASATPINAVVAPTAETQGILCSDASAQDGAAVDLQNLTPGDVELLQQLVARRGDLDKREQDLTTREQALQVVELRVEDKLTELKSLQSTVEATLAQRDEAQEQQLMSLVKIYENMKPKDAAPIFNELDMAILLDVIDRMKEAKAAPILALMEPARTREITKDLAHRSELPATNTAVGN